MNQGQLIMPNIGSREQNSLYQSGCINRANYGKQETEVFTLHNMNQGQPTNAGCVPRKPWTRMKELFPVNASFIAQKFCYRFFGGDSPAPKT